jgi:hypothetical protein
MRFLYLLVLCFLIPAITNAEGLVVGDLVGEANEVVRKKKLR